jgi:hypothetical protein
MHAESGVMDAPATFDVSIGARFLGEVQLLASRRGSGSPVRGKPQQLSLPGVCDDEQRSVGRLRDVADAASHEQPLLVAAAAA